MNTDDFGRHETLRKPGSDGESPLLSLRSVGMQYPGIRALHDIDLDLYPGQVLALVGENGAGKSTLVSILAGLNPGYHGTIEHDGHAIVLHSPTQAQAVGVSVVQQELSLVPEMSVTENIMLGQLSASSLPGFVDRRASTEKARVATEAIGAQLPLKRPVRVLSPAQCQLVEVAKGVARHPRLLILDEPTSSLSAVEGERLLGAVKALRDQGISILYISHKLDEVLSIADRVAVLRDGQLMADAPVGEWDEARLIRSMVGRDLNQFYRRSAHAHDGRVVLEARGLSSANAFADIDLSLRSGEVLGIAGLIGSGRTEVAEALFGLRRITAGQIHIDGQARTIRSPRAAVRHGIGMVSEDRRGAGIVGEMHTGMNVSLASLREFTHAQWIQQRSEQREVMRIGARVNLADRTLRRPIRTLSGGNQQKAVIGRWLMTRPRVLILDEPTRGIDVGAKAEIYALVDELTRSGLAVLLISSEMPEILGLCDRILVLRKGRPAGEFDRDNATEELLMGAASNTTDLSAKEQSW